VDRTTIKDSNNNPVTPKGPAATCSTWGISNIPWAMVATVSPRATTTSSSSNITLATKVVTSARAQEVARAVAKVDKEVDPSDPGTLLAVEALDLPPTKPDTQWCPEAP